MEEVVERVLVTARQRLAEQLTLDDLAKTAMFSKFHFARMFRRVTGVSPRRFIFALRLQEAKRLLVTTSLSVADVSIQVGYSSVGTFTSRFTASVGVSPALYRRLRGNVASVLRGDPPDPAASGVISGRIEMPAGAEGEGPVLVGLLRQPVPEGRPVRCELLGGADDWSFRQVSAGRWYVLGVSLQSPVVDTPSAVDRQPAMMSMNGPFKVSADNPIVELTVRLQPIRPVDPPILFPLVSLSERRRWVQPAGERPVTFPGPVRAGATCYEPAVNAVEIRCDEGVANDAAGY